MKMKKIIGIILSIMLIIGILSGCTSNIVETDSEIIEAELKENLIGSWNAGSAYMSFFDNGEMAMFDTSKGKAEIMPYEVEGDSIILNAEAATLKMFSVQVDEDTLTYTSEQGHKNVWVSVSNEEVMAVLEELE